MCSAMGVTQMSRHLAQPGSSYRYNLGSLDSNSQLSFRHLMLYYALPSFITLCFVIQVYYIFVI